VSFNDANRNHRSSRTQHCTPKSPCFRFKCNSFAHLHPRFPLPSLSPSAVTLYRLCFEPLHVLEAPYKLGENFVRSLRTRQTAFVYSDLHYLVIILLIRLSPTDRQVTYYVEKPPHSHGQTDAIALLLHTVL